LFDTIINISTRFGKQMKNSFLICFSALYLFTGSGLVFHFHYCGSKLKTISLNSKHDEEGCCGSKKKSKRCCQEKAASIKIKDSHHHITHQKVPSSFQVNDFCFNTTLFNFAKRIGLTIAPNYHAPPITNHTPIFIYIRVLLI